MTIHLSPPFLPTEPRYAAYDFDNNPSCLIRVYEAVMSFFTVIAQVIWATITWIADILDSEPNENVPHALTHGQFNQQQHPFPTVTPFVAKPPVNYWGPNHRVATVTASPPSNAQGKLKAALKRIEEIKLSMASNGENSIRFQIDEKVATFNFDAELSRFTKYEPILTLFDGLFDMLTYAGSETVQPFNPHDRTDSLEKFKKRKLAAEEKHQIRMKSLEKISGYHLTGNKNSTDFFGYLVEDAEHSLSQLYHILKSKMKKANSGELDKEQLKTEIRQIIDSLENAYEDCVDQINAQLEPILLSAIVTELKSARGMHQGNIFAAHALFQYRSHLLTHICWKQNQGELIVQRKGILITNPPKRLPGDEVIKDTSEKHMADLERIIKMHLADEFHIGSRLAHTGALPLLSILIADIQEKIDAARDRFQHLYYEEPIPGELDQRPIAYLEAGLKNSIQSAPLEKLRSNLISDWMRKEYGLDTTLDSDNKYVNKDVAAFIEAISEDAENDVFDGGPFSAAGVKWILEASGITKELPARTQFPFRG